MIKLTKKEMKTLEPYETHFKNAIAGFMRGVYQIDINTMQPIYEEHGFKLQNSNCGSCVLIMLKDLGEIYFENKSK